MNRIDKLTIAISGVSLLFVAGCYLGDPSVHWTVFLTLPVSQGAEPPSVNSSEVQTALKLVDRIMVSNGFPADRTPIAAEDRARGLVASYGICGVTLEGDTLAAGCVEANRSHLSPPLVKTLHEVEDAFTRKYGRESVRIEE